MISSSFSSIHWFSWLLFLVFSSSSTINFWRSTVEESCEYKKTHKKLYEKNRKNANILMTNNIWHAWTSSIMSLIMFFSAFIQSQTIFYLFFSLISGVAGLAYENTQKIIRVWDAKKRRRKKGKKMTYGVGFL